MIDPTPVEAAHKILEGEADGTVRSVWPNDLAHLALILARATLRTNTGVRLEPAS